MKELKINPYNKPVKIIDSKAEQESLQREYSHYKFHAIDVMDVKDIFDEQKYELKDLFIMAVERMYPLISPMPVLKMSTFNSLDTLCTSDTAFYFTMLPLPSEKKKAKKEAEETFEYALGEYAKESGYAGDQMTEWIMETTLSGEMRMPELLPENQRARLRLLSKAEETLAVMQNVCRPHSFELNNWYRKIACLCNEWLVRKSLSVCPESHDWPIRGICVLVLSSSGEQCSWNRRKFVYVEICV